MTSLLRSFRSGPATAPHVRTNRAKSKGRRAKGKEQRAKSKEQKHPKKQQAKKNSINRRPFALCSSLFPLCASLFALCPLLSRVNNRRGVAYTRLSCGGYSLFSRGARFPSFEEPYCTTATSGFRNFGDAIELVATWG